MFYFERNGRFERAERKAREVRASVTVAAFGEYFVEGTSQIYAVSIAQDNDGLAITCNCLAGQNDKPCYHAAAAYARHLTLPVETPAANDNLAIVEQDLRRIARYANDMSGDFELMDDIHRAVRSVLHALGDFEAARSATQ